MKKSLKKIIAVLVVAGTFVGYVFSQKNSSTNPVAVSDNTSASNNNNQPQPSATPAPIIVSTLPTPVPASKPSTKPTPKPVPAPAPAPKPKPKPAGAFVDGTYTGVVADAYYGNIQVEAVIQNGMLADVIFLQHPSDRNTSVRINNMAMPQLKSEAIQTQSANVNTISGASASSQAFSQSLQSALNQAKA